MILIDGFSQEIVPVHITAKVRGRTRLFSWIAKISPSTEATVTITKELNLWEKEVYVYKEMFPAIELKRFSIFFIFI